MFRPMVNQGYYICFYFNLSTAATASQLPRQPGSRQQPANQRLTNSVCINLSHFLLQKIAKPDPLNALRCLCLVLVSSRCSVGWGAARKNGGATYKWERLSVALLPNSVFFTRHFSCCVSTHWTPEIGQSFQFYWYSRFSCDVIIFQN